MLIDHSYSPWMSSSSVSNEKPAKHSSTSLSSSSSYKKLWSSTRLFKGHESLGYQHFSPSGTNCFNAHYFLICELRRASAIEVGVDHPSFDGFGSFTTFLTEGLLAGVVFLAGSVSVESFFCTEDLFTGVVFLTESVCDESFFCKEVLLVGTARFGSPLCTEGLELGAAPEVSEDSFFWNEGFVVGGVSGGFLFSTESESVERGGFFFTEVLFRGALAGRTRPSPLRVLSTPLAGVDSGRTRPSPLRLLPTPLVGAESRPGDWDLRASESTGLFIVLEPFFFGVAAKYLGPCGLQSFGPLDFFCFKAFLISHISFSFSSSSSISP
mmetsp:Transcript_17022/g.30563  ORF Transcript_17022/g.30563 Transcript_17022/m.30563 type:complete len:325 (-) Transcript_17022:291-1265(-)